MSGPGAGSEAGEDARGWRARAERAVAALASTGSKRPHALYGPDGDPGAPLHYVRATGCRLETADGRTLVDLTMALGAVALGYADPEVTRRAHGAALAGQVAGLSHVSEVALAERLCELIPCAERALFLKSGAEGVAAVVRLARTVTGRDVVVCSGYFGWLDWTSDAAGVPAGTRADVVRVPFDDVAALETAVDAAGERLALVLLEPVVERPASPAWLAAARAACTRHGAVLAFDEVKTGARLHVAGFQGLTGVVPDVAVFGKAIANGWPLAAVVGHADVMDAARRTWISSTLAGETTALAAAHAVLDRHATEDVPAALRRTGAALRSAVEHARVASGVAGVRTEGIDPMWFLRFDDAARETRFLAATRGAGVLFKRGAYHYAALAHDEAALAAVREAAAAGFAALERG